MEKSDIKGLFNTGLKVLLALILVLNLIVICMESKGGSDFLDSSKVSLLKITGGSMEPVYHNGQVILVRQMDYDKLEIGDNIVFARDDGLITHTIIEKNDEYVITQGTANPTPDNPVSREEYKAKVVTVVPLLGIIWKIYSNALLFTAWMLLLIVLLFGQDIFSAIYEKAFAKSDNK